jgi:heme/copper-type cytochrome/quinol oxidase subunit 3
VRNFGTRKTGHVYISVEFFFFSILFSTYISLQILCESGLNTSKKFLF